MDDKTAKLLTDLANKFGTTAEHLWEVMIYQAAISASVTIAILMFMTASSIYTTRALIRKTERLNGKDFSSSATLQDIVIYVLSIIWVLSTIVTILDSVDDVVTSLLNPEYWALMQIMESLK